MELIARKAKNRIMRVRDPLSIFTVADIGLRESSGRKTVPASTIRGKRKLKTFAIRFTWFLFDH